MTVRKGLARLLGADRVVIGEGRAYLHLGRPETEAQQAEGTLSLDWWNDAALDQAPLLALADGPTLELSVESDKLSGCINGRVLRYTTRWPGSSSIPAGQSS